MFSRVTVAGAARLMEPYPEALPARIGLPGPFAESGHESWAAPRLPSRIGQRALQWLLTGESDCPVGVGAEALALGYADESGVRTVAGAWAREALDASRSGSVRASSVGAGMRRTLLSGFNSDLAILLADEPDGSWGVGYQALATLPAFVARWLPAVAEARPAPSLTVRQEDFRSALSDERARRRLATDSADPMLADARWTWWTVEFGRAGERLDFVEIASLARLFVRFRGDAVDLGPVSADALYGWIARGIAAQA